MSSVQLRPESINTKRRSRSIFTLIDSIETFLLPNVERSYSVDFLNDSHPSPDRSGAVSSFSVSSIGSCINGLSEGFDTTSTSEDNISTLKTPTLENRNTISFPENTVHVKHVVPQLVTTFSSLDQVLSSASRTACVLKYMLLYGPEDPNESLICLLFINLCHDFHQTSLRHQENHHLISSKANQIVSLFLKAYSPIRLPSRVIGFLQDLDDIEKHFHKVIDALLDKARDIVTHELHKMCELVICLGIYASIIPDAVIQGTKNKQEDLELFHDILHERYFKLCSAGHKLLLKPRQFALLWCLKEIGRYFSELEEVDRDKFESLSGQGCTLSSVSGSQSSINDNERTKFLFWNDEKVLGPILNYKGRRKTFLSVPRQSKERHDFTKVQLVTSTQCDQCRDLLWGFEAAECWRCLICNRSFHIACRADLKVKCGTKSSQKLATIAADFTSLAAKIQPRNSAEVSRTYWIHGIPNASTVNENMKRENSEIQSSGYMSSKDSSADALTSAPSTAASTPCVPNISPQFSSSFTDFSKDLPKDDDFFSLPETYECRITQSEFLQHSNLVNEDEDRLYLLSEVHYLIRKIVKDLQVMSYFATQIWRRNCQNDAVCRSFGFGCAFDLIPLYKDIQTIICRYKSQSTYRPYGGAFLEWLKTHQVELFHLTSRLCGCIENKVIWQEVEKQRGQHGPFEAFFEFGYLRFNMKEWMKKLGDLLLFKFPCTIRNVTDKLIKIGFTDEATAWKEIGSWYRRLAVYQNTRVQPLMEAITGGRVDSDVASFIENDLRSQALLAQRRTKFKLFDNFLYDWQEVEVLSMTVTFSSYRHSSDFTLSIKPSQNSTQVSRINIKRKALLFLYQNCLLFLLQSKTFRLKRLEVPMVGGNGSSGLTAGPQRILPVFPLENLVHCTLLNSYSKRMDLFFMEHENFSTQHVKVNFSKESEAEKWKKYFCCYGSNTSKTLKSPDISTSSPFRKSQKKMSAVHFRNQCTVTGDPMFQHFISILDEENCQTEAAKPDLSKTMSQQGKRASIPPPVPQRTRTPSLNFTSHSHINSSTITTGISRPSIIQLSTQMSISEEPRTASPSSSSISTDTNSVIEMTNEVDVNVDVIRLKDIVRDRRKIFESSSHVH